MPTLEALSRAVETAEDLHSVVRTMKTIAAVTIRQYENAIESLAAYNDAVEQGLQVVLRAPALAARGEEVTRGLSSRGRRASDTGRSASRPVTGLCAIVFGSDQGMAGRFNEDIASHTARWLDGENTRDADWCCLVVGERVVGSLAENGVATDALFSLPGAPDQIAPLVQDILLQIQSWRSERPIDLVAVMHNRPLSGAGYEPEALQLLPWSTAWLDEIARRPWPNRVIPMFRGDRSALFSSLIEQYLFVSLYRACAESIAAENASRIASMQAAESNIEERLEELRARYRHERQQQITEELLDIVSGFEALTKKP